MRRKVEWGRGREDKRESRGAEEIERTRGKVEGGRGREGKVEKIKMDEKRKTEKGNGVKTGRGKNGMKGKGRQGKRDIIYSILEPGWLFSMSL